jgi:hypothetical protein
VLPSGPSAGSQWSSAGQFSLEPAQSPTTHLSPRHVLSPVQGETPPGGPSHGATWQVASTHSEPWGQLWLVRHAGRSAGGAHTAGRPRRTVCRQARIARCTQRRGRRASQAHEASTFRSAHAARQTARVSPAADAGAGTMATRATTAAASQDDLPIVQRRARECTFGYRPFGSRA